MLAQVAEAELGMADDFAFVEFFFAEEDFEERTLARTVPADKADLAVIGDRRVCPVEEDLVAELL